MMSVQGDICMEFSKNYSCIIQSSRKIQNLYVLVFQPSIREVVIMVLDMELCSRIREMSRNHSLHAALWQILHSYTGVLNEFGWRCSGEIRVMQVLTLLDGVLMIHLLVANSPKLMRNQLAISMHIWDICGRISEIFQELFGFALRLIYPVMIVDFVSNESVSL